MENPRIDEKTFRRDREIMTAFGLTDARRVVMRVKVTADLPAELLDDEVSTSSATAGIIRATRKTFYVSRKTVEDFSQRKPLFTFWTCAHAQVVARSAPAVNARLRLFIR